MIEPETYHGFQVFKNKLGIRDYKTLQKAEFDWSVVRLKDLLDSTAGHPFDLSLLSAIHHYLFQDVYDWAGELRSYDMSKPGLNLFENVCVFSFADEIKHHADKLFASLDNGEVLNHSSRDDFIADFSYYYSETNKIHPFPEGNGRTQRAFFSLLARKCGYIIPWKRIHRWEIDQTAINYFKGDLQSTVRMFDRVITKL